VHRGGSSFHHASTLRDDSADADKADWDNFFESGNPGSHGIDVDFGNGMRARSFASGGPGGSAHETARARVTHLAGGGVSKSVSASAHASSKPEK
jgi:hypothetical protein